MIESLFLPEFPGKPAWLAWGFAGIVIALQVFDLGALHRENGA